MAYGITRGLQQVAYPDQYRPTIKGIPSFSGVSLLNGHDTLIGIEVTTMRGAIRASNDLASWYAANRF